ncbi:MAG TPA: hypothetical protein ENK10_03315 [Acidobacteria bacterium]|nr:hypothetical protein [Acidobacteriota bacterium]
MMKTIRCLSLVVAVGLCLAAFVSDAQAIPAFARKHNLSCATCHVAMPYLNSTGRAFKEAGYRMPDEDGIVDPEAQPNKKLSDRLVFDKNFPVAARIKGYIYDKKKDSKKQIRPLHEVSILSGGNFWDTGSWFIELEGEDEEDFATSIHGTFGWHPSRAANIRAGIGSILHVDPYNSLQDGMRLTAANKRALSIGTEEDASLRGAAQFINFYGRKGKFFYMAGYSAGNNNPEGNNPQDILGRVAYDFTPDKMVGGFYFDGTHTVGTTDPMDVDIKRYGIDWNLAFGDLYLDGMWMKSETDYGPVLLKANGTQTNTAGFAEFFYTSKRGGSPFFVPLIRYDWTELNDGADQYATITGQLGFYVIENAKLAFEYSKDTEVAYGQAKADRVTVLADIAF